MNDRNNRALVHIGILHPTNNVLVLLKAMFVMVNGIIGRHISGLTVSTKEFWKSGHLA